MSHLLVPTMKVWLPGCESSDRMHGGGSSARQGRRTNSRHVVQCKMLTQVDLSLAGNIMTKCLKLYIFGPVLKKNN
jgi:hypothetical protein